jgi:5'-methylthioadenosine phosphorylase
VPRGRLAVITGSGLAPADVVPDGPATEVTVAGRAVVVRDGGGVVALGRHGPDRRVPAHRVDHHAHLDALARLGCDRVLALASTGSLRPDWEVGTVVAPDDFFAPWATPSRYEDLRGHAVPGFDATWRKEVLAAWRASTTTPVVDGGVYVQTTGPRFETPAEIRFFTTVGDLIGMTVASECVLAREHGLAYAAVCVVDNLANGLRPTPLTVAEFEAGVAANRARFVADVTAVVAHLLEDS